MDKFLTITKSFSSNSKLAVIKDYVHVMKNFDSSLSGEFLFINSCKLSLLFFLCVPQVILLLPLKHLIMIKALTSLHRSVAVSSCLFSAISALKSDAETKYDVSV